MKMEPARMWRYNQERRKYLGRVGKLLNWSVVHVGPEGMESRTPYIVALVEIDGARLVGQLVDIEKDEIKIGLKVKGVLRRQFDVPDDELIVYGVKFAPERKI